MSRQRVRGGTHRAAVLYLLSPCILGRDKTSDPFPGGMELSGRLEREEGTEL